MFVKPFVSDGPTMRRLQVGDVSGGAEYIAALSTAGAGTLTAALLLNSILWRTGPTGAFNETTDTAQNIINALVGGETVGTGSTIGGVGASGGSMPGNTWRLRYVNTVAYAGTLVAGTGVTLVGNTVVNASSVKDFLISITNGTPTQVFAVTTTNSSAVITGMTQAQTNQLSVGMAVTGTGIASSATVISIQPGVGVTLSGNSTATGTLVAVTFSPTVSITGIGQGLL